MNLSPSLNTDSKLDFTTKGMLLADLFNLVGIKNLEMQQATIAKDKENIEQSVLPPRKARGSANPAKRQELLKNGIIKKNFLPKVYKQQLSSFGKDNFCPFPVIPQNKREIADYHMVEETLLEHERKGGFIRVYPNENHVHVYRKFFEEERVSDNILHNYIFNQTSFEGYYKNIIKNS